MDALNIGIDVSKDTLDVASNSRSLAPFQVARTHKGIADLVAFLKSLNVRLVVLEATGGFETIVAAGLGAAGLPVAVVNPARVRNFAIADNQRAKTDRLDALVLAKFADKMNPPVRPLNDEETRALGDLVTRRQQITEMISAEQQRLKRASGRAAKSIERLLKALQKELDDLNTDIDERIRKSPAWTEKVDLLKSVPGVGDQIARVLIADMPELGTLDRRKIAALAGLAPWARQSGKWRGKTFIGGGRASVRRALFMGAMVAARYNPHLSEFRDRLVKAGKPKLVALIAVARKLLTLLNAIIRDKQPWRDQTA